MIAARALLLLALLLGAPAVALAQTEAHGVLGYQDANGLWHAYDTTGAGVPVSGGGGGGGAITAASGSYASGALSAGAIVDLGTGGSPAANTVNSRLATINTTLGSPFQAGGSIANTTFAATQATASSLNATVVGTGTFVVQATTSAVPSGATFVTASATGTTAATTATLPTTSGKLTYICGFTIRANATAAATADATLTNTASGTMHFTQWTAPLASGIGEIRETFTPCIPANATNTNIFAVSAAPGSGGVVSVAAWGFEF